MNFNEKIAENFVYGELVGYKEVNIPTEHRILVNAMNVKEQVLVPVRNRFGTTIITSFVRSKKYNKSVGGVDDSQHVKGEAVDFKVKNKNMNDVFLWIIENLQYDQVILETDKYGNVWIHCSYKIVGNRKQSLIARYDETKKKMIYVPFNL